MVNITSQYRAINLMTRLYGRLSVLNRKTITSAWLRYEPTTNHITSLIRTITCFQPDANRALKSEKEGGKFSGDYDNKPAQYLLFRSVCLSNISA